jgi:hypothetical protein
LPGSPQRCSQGILDKYPATACFVIKTIQGISMQYGSSPMAMIAYIAFSLIFNASPLKKVQFNYVVA